MRGHAKGPFSEQSNLRVQNVIRLAVGEAAQIFISASAEQPVLLKVTPVVTEATTTGGNSLLLGTAASPSAYLAAGDSTPGTLGVGTEKRFVLTADVSLIASFASAAVAATQTLTFSGVATNAQTVTIGGQVYTTQTALTNTANNVLIGANQAATCVNLAAAINAGTGAGTLYGTGTVANASVSAVAVGNTVVLTALTAGTAGNAIATTETQTNASFGAATLAGGLAASSVGEMVVFLDA